MSPTATSDPPIQKVSPNKLLAGDTLHTRGITSKVDDILYQGEAWKAKVTDTVTDATLTRNIETASELDITHSDPENRLLTSDLLKARFEVEIDGIGFSFLGPQRGDRQSVVIKFEDLEIARLRRVHGPKKAFRDQMTRAEFVAQLIREVPGPPIPFYCPELHIKQPVASSQTSQQAGSVPSNPPKKAGEAVPGQQTLVGSSNEEKAFNFFIGHGLSPVQAAGIIGSMQVEAPGVNPASRGTGGGGIVGWTPVTKLTDDASKMGLSPSQALNDLGLQLQVVWWEMNGNGWWQGSQFSLSAYKQITSLSAAVGYFVNNFENAGIIGDRLSPAQAALNKYGKGTPGAVGGTTTTTVTKTQRYAFEVKANETYWAAITRLASEVGWRAFASNGVVYFIDEPTLMAATIAMAVSYEKPGIDLITFDGDTGKKITEVQVTGRARAWAAPPGTVAEVTGQGSIIDGRYLVSQIDSNLFNDGVTVTLKKPTAPLPEPASQTTTKTVSTGAAGGAGATGVGGSKGGAALVAWARTQLGTRSGAKYGCGSAAWCGCFVGYGLTHVLHIQPPSNPAWAPNYASWGQKIGSIGQAQPGDICTWDWSGGGSVGGIDHVNIYMGGGKWIGGNQDSSDVTIDAPSLSCLVSINRPPGL